MCGEMDIFNNDELAFMERHNLSSSDFFDGRGFSRKMQHDIAKSKGKKYIIGAECKKAGHRLRTRNGHCIQCDPSKIKFQKRFMQGGALYVATCGNFCKVGIVENNKSDLNFSVKNREASLNAEGGYANKNTWKIVEFYEIKESVGRVEHEIHRALEKYHVDTYYTHSGRKQLSKEVFKCSIGDALLAIKSVIDPICPAVKC